MTICCMQIHRKEVQVSQTLAYSMTRRIALQSLHDSIAIVYHMTHCSIYVYSGNIVIVHVIYLAYSVTLW